MAPFQSAGRSLDLDCEVGFPRRVSEALSPLRHPGFFEKIALIAGIISLSRENPGLKGPEVVHSQEGNAGAVFHDFP